jgi:hypothetical protein
MTIYEQIKELLKNEKGREISATEIKTRLKEKYGTNGSSIIPSDFCYNRCNDGIDFEKHIFEYLGLNSYRYLDENSPYTGKIYHKPIKQKEQIEIGEWIIGKKTLY